MALTQSARLPGPSWDEEVVPALRKRLESESRTLSRRLSAISLSSADEGQSVKYSDRNAARTKPSSPPSTSSQPSYTSSSRNNQPSKPLLLEPTLSTVSPRINGAASNASKSTATPKFQRARTYSTPHGSDLSNSNPTGGARPKMNPTKSADPSRPSPLRPTDVKPTRIPKAARPATNASTSSSPYVNGNSSQSAAATPSHSPDLPYRQNSVENHGASQRGAGVPFSSSRSTIDLPRANGSRNITPGLLHESPPFPTDATMSSGFSQPSRRETYEEDEPPRPSMESEERPFEHWYRGEVSRNGGVGELRVGRRQEMLDIANYGHLIGNKRAAASKPQPVSVADESRRPQRRRAGSIGGLTNKERERGSVYLSDEHADEVDRVLDEHPPTDFEGSDVHSVDDQFDDGHLGGGAYAYVPSVADVHYPLPSGAEQWTTNAGAHEKRSTTPTPLPRPSSRQNQNLPPSRIPGPSSRRSSDSRSTNTSSIPVPMTRGASEPPQSSSSKTPSPPPAAGSSLNSRTQTQGNNLSASTSTPQKRGVSPATKKGRTSAKTKTKSPPSKRDDRASVAHYPTVEGDELADAIPSWTQPLPREGNWDEVVLPVVARKKGLDGYYENADGSPQAKNPERPEHVAPAPGTFGYDHTKYRQPRATDEFIPMDEFGRPAEEKHDDGGYGTPANGLRHSHEDNRPIRGSPSPAPFSHYAPTTVQVLQASDIHHHRQELQQLPEEDEKAAGCCKCVIM